MVSFWDKKTDCVIDNSILRGKKKDFCSKIYHEPESLVKVIMKEIFLS